ncbi:MAG: carboxypeptidase regulatory-like domain-containing protein [Planctomycetes bacterium]|nr:carboxypeptidase regulatory-like domain-containing protein [Planctomycetota bacterium]
MSRSLLVLLGVLALAGLAALLWLTGDAGTSRDAHLESGSARADGTDGLSDPLLAPVAADAAQATEGGSTHPLLRTQRDAAAPAWRSAGWILAGRVENASGDPLPGVEVAATLDAEVRSIGSILDQIASARRGRAATRTDAQGRFVLRDLPETALRVRAWRDDGAQIERGGVRAAPAGAEVEPLVLRFEAGLELTILYRDGEGRPLAGQHLAALRNLEDRVLGLESTALTTGEDGLARAAGIAPGRYTIVAFPAEGSLQSLRVELQLYTDTRLELDASPAGRLELLVRDAQRAPVAGAHFLALVGSGRGGGLVHGTTNLEGLLVIERAPLGRLQLAFVHAVGHTSWPPSPESMGRHEVSAEKPCRIEIELAAVRALRGRVIDGATGAPLAQTELRFRTASDPRGAITARARTDADGTFALERIPRERLHLGVASSSLHAIEPELAPLSIFANREEEGAWDWIDLSAADAPERLELKVPAPGVLAGVVRDESGEIAANHELVATLDRRGFRCRVETRSDEKGGFRFEGLHTPATWNVAPLRATEGFVPLEQRLEAGAGADGLVLRLPSRLLLRGTVTGEGAPVAGARVIFVTPSQQRILRRTDARGAFEIALAAPSLRVQVEAQGFARYEQTIEAANGAFAPLSIELLRAIELEGSVRDAAQAPLAEARVQWIRRAPDGKRSRAIENARTDGAGEFRFGALTQGPGELEVQRPGYRRWSRSFEDPRAAHGIQITLELGLTLSGIVLLPDGSPAAGARVDVSGAGQPGFRVVSREDGTFEVAGLEEGTCSIEASPAEATTSIGLRGSESSQAPAGSTGIELRLRPGAVLRGSVDGSELFPSLRLSSVLITAIDAEQRELATGQPDDQGRFVLSGLAPEAEVRVLVSAGMGIIRYEAFGPFRPGGEIGPLRLQRGGGLSGRLVDRAGQPVAGIRVTCVDASDRAGLTPPQITNSDKDGRFHFVGCSLSSLKLLFLLPTTPRREQVVDGVHAGGVELEIALDL